MRLQWSCLALWTILLAWSSPAVAQMPPAPLNAKALKLYLLEGSVVTGELSVDSLTVTTDFGELKIPVASIRSFTPGLNSHPQQRTRILELIQALGANVAKERDEAQKSLSDMGLSIRNLLDRYVNDEDTERRTRIRAILDEIEQFDDDEVVEVAPLIDHDTVETDQFTVVGDISPKSFEVNTKFGPLKVALTDIRDAKRDQAEPTEIHKIVAVSGENLVPVSFKGASIRVKRNDKIIVKAEGSIVMTPWGNNATSTPDGNANYQWYIPNKIPGGALVAKIGSSGPVFKVGSSYTFTATKTGELYFGIAMNPQFLNQGNVFPGEYKVTLRINPK